jgi:cyclomaltodextrinase / maltogenic alpha-amylase / neopullulanase
VYHFALAAIVALALPIASQGKGANPSSADVPEWAKRAVWYQIFPERFRNGDTANDPRVTDIRGSWPHDSLAHWSVSPWTSDWYRLQPWESGDTNGFFYHVQARRYGGDLQGVIDKLDYLSDLGITALYFNPLFESPSLHKYDASMYHHIDNNFGPDPEGDRALWATENPADPKTWKWSAADKLFLTLLREAHRRGMKVIIDGVFNHVGMTFWAFEDVKQKQDKSEFKDWFIIKRWDDPSTPANEFEYGGWYGVRELPELRKVGDNIAPGPRAHIHAIVKRWMDPDGDGNPSDGVDGWRLDAADMVGPGFWRDLRTWVRTLNPQAYLVGEVWWEDWKNDKMYNAAPWLKGDMFDAVMNYRWAREACRYFVDRRDKISVSEFNRRLSDLRADYPGDVNGGLMNLFDSHDTDRLESRIVNPDLPYDHSAGLHDSRTYDPRKPNDDEIRVQKLMALFQMTYLGAPVVYYGDEVGMWGGDDPDDRKPMLWGDLTYDDESGHPFGLPRPVDKNVVNLPLLGYYKKLIGIRKQRDALMTGEFGTLLTDDSNDVYAFMRSAGGSFAVVVINNSSSKRKATIPLPAEAPAGGWVNLLDSTLTSNTQGEIGVELAPKTGAILEPVR